MVMLLELEKLVLLVRRVWKKLWWCGKEKLLNRHLVRERRSIPSGFYFHTVRMQDPRSSAKFRHIIWKNSLHVSFFENRNWKLVSSCSSGSHTILFLQTWHEDYLCITISTFVNLEHITGFSSGDYSSVSRVSDITLSRNDFLYLLLRKLVLRPLSPVLPFCTLIEWNNSIDIYSYGHSDIIVTFAFGSHEGSVQQ